VRRTHWIVLAVGVAAIVGALFVPLPSPWELRDWARAAGPLAPLLLFLAHAVVTTTPLPRTAFTLAAGLIFGPWWGLGLCVAGSTVSAILGFAVARRLGPRAVARLGSARIRRLEQRLSRRGLLTVVSARLLPALPFAPLNYAFGVTSVRYRDYVPGTLVGLVPGTAAVVLLGDAVVGGTSPTMIVIFVISGAIGVIVAALAVRADRRPPRGRVA